MSFLILCKCVATNYIYLHNIDNIMNQLRRSITLDRQTDEWVRDNITNFSGFVRDAIEDEKLLRKLQDKDDNSIHSTPSPFRQRLRMFERYRLISKHIALRWNAEEKPYRCGLHGRWRKWQKKEQETDAGLIPCLDHLGFYKDGDQICATIEPYGYNMACAKRLIEYCEKRGLMFVIDAESSHAPGACIRIKIYEE